MRRRDEKSNTKYSKHTNFAGFGVFRVQFSSRIQAAGLGLLAVTMAAACLTVLLLVLESPDPGFRSGPDESRWFQHAVGGLGMGSSAAPAWNLLYYDPRLQPLDDSNLWPVAGAYPFSPSAFSTVVTFRELPREDLQILKVGQ